MTTHFKPPQIKRSFEEISSEFKKLIFQGVFKPGDRLPSQIEIARQFNVGRQMIPESMRTLEKGGFITIQQGVKGGPFIVVTILNRLSALFILYGAATETSVGKVFAAGIVPGILLLFALVVASVILPQGRITTG
jgi:DNA-binding FadR family transcriptional regulator